MRCEYDEGLLWQPRFYWREVYAEIVVIRTSGNGGREVYAEIVAFRTSGNGGREVYAEKIMLQNLFSGRERNPEIIFYRIDTGYGMGTREKENQSKRKICIDLRE